MHQANREAVFAWLDACNRKPKAELLRGGKEPLHIVLTGGVKYGKIGWNQKFCKTV